MSGRPVIDEDLARRLAASAESVPAELADPEAAMDLWRSTSTGPVPPWRRRRAPLLSLRPLRLAVAGLARRVALAICHAELRRTERRIRDTKLRLVLNSVRLQDLRVHRDTLEFRALQIKRQQLVREYGQ